MPIKPRVTVGRACSSRGLPGWEVPNSNPSQNPLESAEGALLPSAFSWLCWISSGRGVLICSWIKSNGGVANTTLSIRIICWGLRMQVGRGAVRVRVESHFNLVFVSDYTEIGQNKEGQFIGSSDSDNEWTFLMNKNVLPNPI